MARELTERTIRRKRDKRKEAEDGPAENRKLYRRYAKRKRPDPAAAGGQIARKRQDRLVSRWETGRNMPDYAVLEPLTEELGISVNELIRGKKIPSEDIVREYDNNLVAVLKEYKKLKKAKRIIMAVLVILAGITLWLAFWLALALLPAAATIAHAKVEVCTDISRYGEYMGANARKEYQNKCGMDESIFPNADSITPNADYATGSGNDITTAMNIGDYKMVYYNPWDPQWLSYLVVDYGDELWAAECARLRAYPSTEYLGCYGVTGFGSYEPLAVCAGANGLVYALADPDRQRIIYVELIFHNYFLDLDCTEYIPAAYLPDGFDASKDNPYRSFQISLLYSSMVLSDEKNPAFAILTSIILRHFF